MLVYVACQKDGNYMLSFLEPTWERIAGTNECDWYVLPGEPLGVRHLCRAGVKQLGVVLKPGEIRRVKLEVTQEES